MVGNDVVYRNCPLKTLSEQLYLLFNLSNPQILKTATTTFRNQLRILRNCGNLETRTLTPQLPAILKASTVTRLLT
ncbi:MAG: hypothetical protein SAK29_29080 [Scytonema sp. PMC 1069.18]|nr:hypothetical protein [Scytonema sp. PMC 1069.18]MEC4888088.1 hypothetical protein [Scytonema sp. PMC 1070.18]